MVTTRVRVLVARRSVATLLPYTLFLLLLLLLVAVAVQHRTPATRGALLLYELKCRAPTVNPTFGLNKRTVV